MMRRTPFAFLLFALAAPLSAQEPPPGIQLRAQYTVTQRPLLAVRPFEGAAPIAAVLDSMTAIVQRDLRFSDRYNIMEPVPTALRTGAVDYRQWNSLNVVYLVTGQVTPGTSGYQLQLAVHDVVYNRVLEERSYVLPPAADPDFRMAMHAISDEVVRRTLNVPGSAATRIAVTRQNEPGSYDLLLVDSDGYGLRRIAGNGGQLYSPAWSPDGQRVLYTINTEAGWRLVERDIRSGSSRTVNPNATMAMTPAYAPGGGKIAMSAWIDGGARVVEYDLARQCCMKRLTGSGRTEDMSPSFSADGRQIVFMSNRLGNPHIYVMPAGGGSAALLSRYVRGESSHYTAPAWSPTNTRIAFHGTWDQRLRGNFQIMLADASRPGAVLEQITARGNNEDPSWAPDGRHIVYTSVGDGAGGLYIIDTETKNRRLLAGGGNLRMADWSPLLLRAQDLVMRP